MGEPERISARELHDKLAAGEPVLVICGYRSDHAYRKYRIADAISMNDLDDRLPTLPADQEFVFYCACAEDKTAILNAQAYMERGYASCSVLEDGFDGWHAKGLQP
ncbi:MAG: rhodanese-like domain-containing protein [Planctomycetota bacterium]|jgi:rhodanese-related sulfurtransferase